MLEISINQQPALTNINQCSSRSSTKLSPKLIVRACRMVQPFLICRRACAEKNPLRITCNDYELGASHSHKRTNHWLHPWKSLISTRADKGHLDDHDDHSSIWVFGIQEWRQFLCRASLRPTERPSRYNSTLGEPSYGRCTLLQVQILAASRPDFNRAIAIQQFSKCSLWEKKQSVGSSNLSLLFHNPVRPFSATSNSTSDWGRDTKMMKRWVQNRISTTIVATCAVGFRIVKRCEIFGGNAEASPQHDHFQRCWMSIDFPQIFQMSVHHQMVICGPKGSPFQYYPILRPARLETISGKWYSSWSMCWSLPASYWNRADLDGARSSALGDSTDCCESMCFCVHYPCDSWAVTIRYVDPRLIILQFILRRGSQT